MDMAKKQSKAIRFLVPWNGRAKGSINRELRPGIMQTLVDYHKAEWVNSPRRQRVATETTTDQ